MTKTNRFIVNHHLINHDSDLNELLVLEPDNKTLVGDILFFHGHQVGVRMGAWETPRYLGPLLAHGYRVIVPSILGYGKTTGEPDYCGPNTLHRVESTIKNFINGPIHVMGASRGGTLAVLFAEYFPELTRSCTAIAGTYDLESMMSHISDQRMKENILMETGGTTNAYKIRDPKTHWEKLSAPLHIMHGLKDEQIPVEQAQAFTEFLEKNGRSPKVSILEAANHKLFSEQIFKDTIIPFLEAT